MRCLCSLVLLALVACVPEIPEGTLLCSPNPSDDLTCPGGFTCGADLRCYRDSVAVDDASIEGRSDGGELDAGVDASGADDAGEPAAIDAAVESTPDAGALITCQTPDSGVQCDDGKVCNGVERCAPAEPGADVRGCVAGTPMACATGETCSEARASCTACVDGASDDGDGDGFRARACGGNDCDDGDQAVYVGHSELCNGKDDDCDGIVDGDAANAACASQAPANGSATCSAGACVPSCAADFDLVAGSCVRHDDCAGGDKCAGGTCVDGVGTFTCTCGTGYESAAPSACVDIDECARGLHDCTPSLASCINDPGGYRCACRAGYIGTGRGERGCFRAIMERPCGGTTGRICP